MSTGYTYPPVSPVQDVINHPGPAAAKIGGILGARMDAIRRNRLHRIIDHPLMLSGFEKKDLAYPWKPQVSFEDSSWEGDISFAWQGEHVGKWLHAAVMLGLGGGCIRAFSRGPLVLAAKGIWPDARALSCAQGSAVPEPMDMEPDGEPRYRLPLHPGTENADGSATAEAVLMPYYLAGAENGSVVTWFRTG